MRAQSRGGKCKKSQKIQEADGGSITKEGIYTAPEEIGIYHAIAMATIDGATLARVVGYSPKRKGLLSNCRCCCCKQSDEHSTDVINGVGLHGFSPSAPSSLGRCWKVSLIEFPQGNQNRSSQLGVFCSRMALPAAA
jgi:hypothetical protein